MATTKKRSGGSRAASGGSRAASGSRSSGGKRTSSGKRASGGGSRASSSRSGSAKRQTAPAPKPFRREVGALVCLLLAIFAAFGYFHMKALFIDLFCALLKGLLGYGFWLMPPALVLCAYILAFHRGRPVALRLCCALALPLALSVMLQVTSYKLTGKRIFKMSPIHHHFEMSGYSEVKIVLLFSLVALIGCGLGVWSVFKMFR